MAKMRAIDAAVRILEKEGVVCAFGVPGAAINPLYSALKKRGSIRHILARHVEGASHMAEGYTRARAGSISVCIGTSGPAGTDMITALYSAIADSIPILCITGQAPRARLYKEDFQAVDIEQIAKPVTKWAVTVREPALVPRVSGSQAHDAAAKRFRRDSDQAAACLSGDEPGVRARDLLCQCDRIAADCRRAVSRRLSSTQLDQCGS